MPDPLAFATPPCDATATVNSPSASPAQRRAAIGRQVAARLDADPAAVRAPSAAARIYSVPAFLDAAECAGLIALIDRYSRPSTLLATSDDPEYRTSDSSDLNPEDPLVARIDSRIAALLGLPPAHAETLQGQRYGVDQQFRAHCDWFHQNSGYWADMQATGGQRTWTAMIYLNDVAEGGATWFPRAGVRFRPSPGLLIAWNNMADDGEPNNDTLHEGMRVSEGTKYIVTKWFREEPWLRAPIRTFVAGRNAPVNE
jgi:prolyl 4-hydroxylase